MKNRKNLLVLIAILAALASALTIWKLFLSQPQKAPVLPTPTPTPLEVSGRGEPGLYEKISQETQESFPLIALLPHRTQTWSLDYLGPLHLEAVIKTKDLEAVKTEILKWIGDQGVDPSTHQIDWKNSP